MSRLCFYLSITVKNVLPITKSLSFLFLYDQFSLEVHSGLALSSFMQNLFRASMINLSFCHYLFWASIPKSFCLLSYKCKICFLSHLAFPRVFVYTYYLVYITLLTCEWICEWLRDTLLIG